MGCIHAQHTSIGALALRGGYFGQGNGYTAVSDVSCDPARDMTLLECCSRVCRSNNERIKYCDRDRDSAGVRCIDVQRLKNISTTLISTTGTTHFIILITWQLQQNSTAIAATYEPRSFEVSCFNEWHSIKMSLSNTTFTTQVGGLLPSSSYTCCVSAVYDSYMAKGVCTQLEIPGLELLRVTTETACTNSNRTTIEAANSKSMNALFFGVLGSIITFFLVLSALLCVALIYQVRKKSKESVHVMPMR